MGVAEVPTQDMSEVSIDIVGPKKLKNGSAQDMSEVFTDEVGPKKLKTGSAYQPDGAVDSILSRDKGGCGTEKCTVSD